MPDAMPRKPSETPPRVPNLLTQAAEDAQRGMLLRVLEENGWRLRETARALGMVGPGGLPQPSSVLRMIRALGVEDTYRAHRPTK